ncbi:hypothetical protein STSP2_01953 [Anaerohalosphaera lusitana]|uniref:Uncharacterized protein n=1 Tax=Anaerohalosphaera lusitana TaxID=1936003 RepID=A0A1U9NMF9_9BACT|nr:hypothetical protein [Anaerohalosphaera lusitana]AQT68780.1 hypothetical protein STSP2_01953 [Anaerohalosphaera lusitana]
MWRKKIDRIIPKVREEIENPSPDVSRIDNHDIFVLCQYLRGLGIPKNIDEDQLEDIFYHCYEQLEDILLDEDGDTLSEDEAWSQFIEVWPKIRIPKGFSFQKAVDKAKKMDTPLEIEIFSDERLILLGKVCYQLQLMVGDGLFWLSGYDAGKILGISQPRARRFLKTLVDQEILELVKSGNRRKASEYRYLPALEYEARTLDDTLGLDL